MPWIWEILQCTWCIMEFIFLWHLPAKLYFTSMNSGPGIKNDWIYSCCCSGRCWDDWIYHVRLSACLISSVHHWNSLVELLQNISDYVRASLMSAVSLAQSYQTLTSVKTSNLCKLKWNKHDHNYTTPLTCSSFNSKMSCSCYTISLQACAAIFCLTWIIACKVEGGCEWSCKIYHISNNYTIG